MNLWKKLSITLLAGMLAFGSVASAVPANQAVVQAAETYTYKTDKNNKTFKGDKCTITVKNYYKRIVLSGSSKAVASINKQLKRYSDEFMSKESGAFEYASEDCNNRTADDTYDDYVTQKVTYLSDDIISIQTTSNWYAGGVGNTNVYGYTFNRKTGKLIKKITSVTKTTSLSSIKKTLKKSIKAKQFDPKELDNMKADDFQYYINSKGKVIVCFGPYALGYGGWTKKFTLSGKYE